MYSSDCSQSCNCDRKTSTGCDVKTGACICQEGYGGADCSCHVTIASQCAGVHTFCDFDKCLCRDGVFDKPLSCSGKYNNLRATIIWVYIMCSTYLYHTPVKVTLRKILLKMLLYNH